MFKIHPEIPESLSAETRAFILLCFEPDPTKRVTASDLLKDSFLKQVNKGKKSRIAFKPSGKVLSAKSKSTSSLRVIQALSCTKDISCVRKAAGPQLLTVPVIYN